MMSGWTTPDSAGAAVQETVTLKGQPGGSDIFGSSSDRGVKAVVGE